MIKIKNLSKIYNHDNKSIEALKNINLTIENGDIYGIIGLSGAGKSSLVRCINALEKTSSGEILINFSKNPEEFLDVTKLTSKELRNLRKKIGMIFQHFNLLMNSTVYENIAFPLKLSNMPKKDIERKVLELLSLVGLSHKKDVYPSRLSGGEKQRVGIARALANNPEILLCDEATSALDPSTTESILSLLRDINKKFNITIIVITHEMEVIKKLCNKVAVLDSGIISEKGYVLDIFSNPQSKTSKEFLKDYISKIPHDLEKAYLESHEKLIRVYFKGKETTKPIISKLSREFDLDVNILSGNIESINNISLGNLLIKISGNEEKLKEAIAYLKNLHLRVETL